MFWLAERAASRAEVVCARQPCAALRLQIWVLAPATSSNAITARMMKHRIRQQRSLTPPRRRPLLLLPNTCSLPAAQRPAPSAALRGVLAETALTGVQRFDWRLLQPLLHRLVDLVLADFGLGQEAEVSHAGAPGTFPGSSLAAVNWAWGRQLCICESTWQWQWQWPRPAVVVSPSTTAIVSWLSVGCSTVDLK